MTLYNNVYKILTNIKNQSLTHKIFNMESEIKENSKYWKYRDPRKTYKYNFTYYKLM